MSQLSQADLNGGDTVEPGNQGADPGELDANGAAEGSPAHPTGTDGARLPFRLVVEWAQAITARSVTMVGGRWEQGTFYPGELLELIPATGDGQVSHQVRGTHIDAVGPVGADHPLGNRFGVVVEGIGPAQIRAGDILQALP